MYSATEKLKERWPFSKLISPALHTFTIYMKKLLDYDWLRAMQFKCKTIAKGLTQVKITPLRLLKGLHSSRDVMILRKYTTFFDFENIFR